MNYLVLFFSFVTSILGQNIILKPSLLIIDQYNISQILLSDMSITTMEHNIYHGDIQFITSKRFGNIFVSIFGGCSSPSVGYLLQVNSSKVSSLLLDGLVKVCHAVPAFSHETFYALMDKGDIVHINYTDLSRMTISPPPDGSTCPLRSNIQVDYNNRLLYFLDCSPEYVYFLKKHNLDVNTQVGKLLTKKINKFHIDFSNNNIFAISDKSLYKGQIDDSNIIQLSELQKFSSNILDFALTPTDVYLIITGYEKLYVIGRSGTTATTTMITFTGLQAVGYFDDFAQTAFLSPASLIITWIIHLIMHSGWEC